jgi:hypothetical protein
MTSQQSTSNEPMLFIIYRPCGCLNFNPEEIEQRYCGGCKTTHPNEGDWFLYEPSMGEAGMSRVFHAYLAARDRA